MNIRPTVDRLLPRVPWTRARVRARTGNVPPDRGPDPAQAIGEPAGKRRSGGKRRLGPGGGEVTSHARCVARIALEPAVAAAFGCSLAHPRWLRPHALGRALLAWIFADASPQRAAELYDERAWCEPNALPHRLSAALTDVPPSGRPAWVPGGAFALALGADPAAGVAEDPPSVRDVVPDPHLAAWLAARLRGPLFLREASPDVGALLEWQPSRGPWELWVPEPEAVRPPGVARGAAAPRP